MQVALDVSTAFLHRCTNMYKVSRRCYEIFANSGVVKAPSSEYLRKITTAPYDAPGIIRSQRYEEIAQEVESWTEQARAGPHMSIQCSSAHPAVDSCDRRHLTLP